jgi:Rieske 2Fe-2S family protein
MAVPAPINEAALRRCLGSFPSEARTLPAEAYVSHDVFAWEQEAFFERSWVCVGRSGDLGAPGDQRAAKVGNEAILLVRGRDDMLRGFFNTCRHRGHELVPSGEKAVNAGAVRCPYHRWMYDLDGAFKGGPGLASQEGFDRNDPDHNLVPARVDEWAGWAFVNVSGDAPDLASWIGALDELMTDYEPERLFLGARHDYELQANWKIIVENYHECYHCTEIHPELCRVSSPGSGHDFEPDGAIIGGSMELNDGVETMSLSGESLGVPFRRLEGARLRDVYYLEVFPNLLLSIHPDYVMTHRLEPSSPGTTRVECTWLFPPEARERADFDPSYAAEFWDVTNRQDWGACEAVQRGASGRGYRQAPFSVQERVVHQSMGMVARGYLEGRVRPVAAVPATAPAHS